MVRDTGKKEKDGVWGEREGNWMEEEAGQRRGCDEEIAVQSRRDTPSLGRGSTALSGTSSPDPAAPADNAPKHRPCSPSSRILSKPPDRTGLFCHYSVLLFFKLKSELFNMQYFEPGPILFVCCLMVFPSQKLKSSPITCQKTVVHGALGELTNQSLLGR